MDLGERGIEVFLGDATASQNIEFGPDNSSSSDDEISRQQQKQRSVREEVCDIQVDSDSDAEKHRPSLTSPGKLGSVVEPSTQITTTALQSPIFSRRRTPASPKSPIFSSARRRNRTKPRRILKELSPNSEPLVTDIQTAEFCVGFNDQRKRARGPSQENVPCTSTPRDCETRVDLVVRLPADPSVSDCPRLSESGGRRDDPAVTVRTLAEVIPLSQDIESDDDGGESGSQGGRGEVGGSSAPPVGVKQQRSYIKSILADVSLSSPSISSCDSGRYPGIRGFTQDQPHILSPYQPSEHQLRIEKILNSDKRRKPVKGGQVSKLDTLLRAEKSKKNLRNHQLSTRNLTNTSLLRLRVTEILLLHGVVSLRGRDPAGTCWRVLLHEEFCLARPPQLGWTLVFSPPWSKIGTIEGESVIFGVYSYEVASGQEGCPEGLKLAGPEGDTSVTGKKGMEIDLACRCQTDPDFVCEDDEMYRGLSAYGTLKPTFDPVLVNPLHSPHPPSPAPVETHLTMPSPSVTVLDLVDRLGGCSSSPQTRGLSLAPPSLPLTILQPYSQLRNYGHIGSELEIGFVARDDAGNILLVKLDSEHRSESRDWGQMVRGEWEPLLGSRVRLLGAYPQTRTTLHRDRALFQFASALGKCEQRFFYTLKVYNSSRLKILDVPSNPSPLQALKDVLSCDPTGTDNASNLFRRYNIQCTAVYVDKESQRIYITHNSVSDSPTPFLSVRYTPECVIPAAQHHLHIYGLILQRESSIPEPPGQETRPHPPGQETRPHPPGQEIRPQPPGQEGSVSLSLWLDHLSGVWERGEDPVSYRRLAPLHTTLRHLAPIQHTTFYPSPSDPHIVRFIGKVSSVVTEESIEYATCSECRSENLLEVEEEAGIKIFCYQCNRITEPRMTLRLVVLVGSLTIFLREATALSLLQRPEEDGSRRTPEEIVNCRIDILGIARENTVEEINIK